VFNIWVDGRLIWNKKEIGRFPEEAEILAQIRAK
jgi:selT/selW/selH-like putative selenoprotein